MAGGKRCIPRVTLIEARARAKRELDALPERLRRIEPASPRYAVEISEALTRDVEIVRRQHEVSDVSRVFRPSKVRRPGL
jgi:hypothetical protein